MIINRKPERLFFAWKDRPASRRQQADLMLLAHARSAFALLAAILYRTGLRRWPPPDAHGGAGARCVRRRSRLDLGDGRELQGDVRLPRNGAVARRLYADRGQGVRRA
ncbi:hypothetical protein [Sphingomonas metalli]|uniref:hypothetical protein n=1 Tax=Sphingomonas metalli TaxID=1779358 RepID=UPI001E5B5185|nr:hypothetical protein [Sphingomonas metalli]